MDPCCGVRCGIVTFHTFFMVFVTILLRTPSAIKRGNNCCICSLLTILFARVVERGRIFKRKMSPKVLFFHLNTRAWNRK